MSLSAANPASSIYGTPSRAERLPFPQSHTPSPAHTPHRQPASSSSTSHTPSFSTASASSITTPLPPANKDRPLTSSSLLKANADAPDPKMAALEAAVTDRNVLSSQNAQLWKLIEKQRAGYNQILKELERVRSERDAYKAKLGAPAGNKEDRRNRAGDTKRTFSESQPSVPDNAASNGDPKPTVSRYSDDQRAFQFADNCITTNTSTATPRSAHHHTLHSSRSHEPLSPRNGPFHAAPSFSASSSSLAPPSQAPSLPPPPSSAPSAINVQTANANPRSAKPSPTPLIVPPRAENLPVPASALSATQETNPFGHFSMHDSSSTSSVDLESHHGTNYPRKPSLADSISSGVSVSTTTSSHISSSVSNATYGTSSTSATSTYTPSPQHYQYTGALTPQTAPPGFGGPSPDSHQSSLRTATTPVTQSQPYPQVLTTPTAMQIGNTPSNGMLTTIPEGRPSLSRESRISLPDEARQYIANMADSPIPSPHIDAFAKQSSRVQPQIQISEHPGGLEPPSVASLVESDSPGATSSEFLDLAEDDEDDEDEADDEQSAAPETDEVPDNVSLQETPRPPRQVMPPLDPPHLAAHGRKVKPRVEVDLFPLPPNVPPPYASGDIMQNPYSPAGQPQPSPQPMRIDTRQVSQQSLSQSQPLVQTVPANFRALPLLPTDLPQTTITVSHSFVRPNDRGKEVLSFVVFVDPGNGKEGWKVEKMYSDVLGLDQRVRSAVGKGMGKKITSLPEGKLWRDHAPAKVDQRKAVLETYLQMLINLPVKENNEVIAFFTSDIVRETKQPVMQIGHKEGYLTKRGKNFGGWKTRYFVLQGPVLEYYDCLGSGSSHYTHAGYLPPQRGGAHLGSILITGAQIGRQQRSERAPSTDEEKEYRHAFLIVEAKKGPGGSHPRHVLCAETDDDRDAWVEILVRYFSGTYSEEPIKYGPATTANAAAYQNGVTSTSQPRSSTSSNSESPTSRRPTRGFSKDDILISKGAAVPISQLPPDQNNAKLFPPAVGDDYVRSASPSKQMESPVDPARRILERGQGQPSSLPDSSPLSSVSNFHSDSSFGTGGQRANSELGHYPDLSGRSNRQVSPERHRTRDPHDKRKSFHPTLNPVASSPTHPTPADRVPSPDKLEANSKVKISGPLNGAPIPSGFKFGGKETTSASESTAADRRLKSRSFWGFGKPNGDKSAPAVTYIPRAVFGVALEESLDVAQIANLPAIVFRSIQYLEAKKADQEEGIYRLSGSSAVIKSLKDRFNMEGDVDLLASDEYWDPHAIAGLLKSFLRELPASILTRDLHLKFLAVIDFVDPQERIKELSQLIASLPLANYSLLRALTAHLILIVQNSSVNKMTMRNVGIVFSPTLGIPAGVFSLMLGEFNRVFNVDDADAENATEGTVAGDADEGDMNQRNSKHYSDAAADQLLGLTGRTLKTLGKEPPSDGDDLSVHDESGTETTDGDFTLESSSESGPGSTQHADGIVRVTAPPETPKSSRVTNLAATRGLNVTVTGSERGNRHSRMIGLPTSPRPTQTTMPVNIPPSPSHPRRDGFL
ncbi:hypothetical protein H0H81_001065 [Sphagnurus paluster]|uniref:RhoGAP-domain-containing protein n=1 Tax=Sphagnurus paluster TaxID=117069 RepID=A0A9P7KM12_9AGAR|nr:hypothetical protein H0H81_001065 [Sphagnurus paluster]